uniref:Pre-mRNA-splicing factor clf1-like n=1 Tax=Elaeis guineensis var. tenera TaxID=51953 RepID=A0A6I9RKY4_ELAGV|nr:pre-mRNA-splicing factor clf1-like [Elaeis guineensis]
MRKYVAQWMNPMMEQRRHSKRQGETAVAAVTTVVPTIESTPGTAETDRAVVESDLETATVGLIKLKRSLSEIEHARAIFELAIAQLTLDMLELLLKAYIDFEISGGEYERIRQLYKRLLDQTKYLKVWISNARFEASASIEDEEYAELKRSLNEIERAQAIFELAIAQLTLDMSELLWKAYIDFEISEGEYERIRQLHERLLDRIKYLKVWISYVRFKASIGIEDEEVGGEAPDTALLYEKLLWKVYIDFEISGGEYERIKQLYERQLDRTKHLKVWISYARFETSAGIKDEEVGGEALDTVLLHEKRLLSEIKRARAILELAIAQLILDMPKLLWKAYIDFKILENEYERTR